MFNNISYNVVVERFKAFADGHFLIRRFTHGQVDQTDLDKDQLFPWMHVAPVEVRAAAGARVFTFDVIFADIPRDKEDKTDYQKESISDCIRLAEDLLSEIQNGQVVFSSLVEVEGESTITPFIEEWTHTLSGCTLALTISVPNDYSACDIPADWSIGGGGSGTPPSPFPSLILKVNNIDNVVQNILDLVDGDNVTIEDLGDGRVRINSTGGGGGGSAAWGAITGTLSNQTDLQTALNLKANISSLGAVAFSNNYNDLDNLPTIPAAQVNSDWNAVAGVAQILNKPAIPAYLDDLADVNAGSPNDGDILIYFASGNEWKNQPNTGGGTVTSVGLLVPSPGVPAFSVSGSPVTTSGNLQINALGTSLQYIDGEGALQTFPNVPKFLSDLISGSAPGQLLQWNGTQWVVISMLALDDLSDVSATTPSNGQVLAYNTGTGKWEALTLPSLSGYVPYVGATQDVNLDTFKLSASSVYIEGTNGNGHLHLKHQSADATATGQSTSLWADTNGDIKWKNDGNYKTTLKTSANVADRTYIFPDEDCTLMPRNAAITGATKTKITYDADGLVTAGEDLAAGDMPTGIDATKIGTGTVSNTEFGYLDGVTSAIQTQLNNKKDTITYGQVYGSTVGASSTIYFAITGLTAGNATETNRQFAVPVAGTIRDFYVKMSGTQSATGTLVITIRNNAASSSVTLTVSSADGASPTKSNTANTLAVAAGDLISIQAVNNATVTSASILSMAFIIERT